MNESVTVTVHIDLAEWESVIAPYARTDPADTWAAAVALAAIRKAALSNHAGQIRDAADVEVDAAEAAHLDARGDV